MKQVLTEEFVKYLSKLVVSSKSDLSIAIGAGNSSWDSNPEEADPSTTSLVDQKAVSTISKVEYLDSNNSVTDDVTSKLKITSAIFSSEDYENFDSNSSNPVRECGLFYDNELLLYSIFSRIDITEQSTLTKVLIIDLTML